MAPGTIDRFLAFLPADVDRWVLAGERRWHARLLAALAERLPLVAALDLIEDDPAAIAAAADRWRDDPRCGFVELAVTDAADMAAARVDALMRFARWPESRVRFCFDVADENVDALFAESPADLAAGCAAALARLGRMPTLVVRSGEEAALRVERGDRPWRAIDGTHACDYLLPAGEIECAPAGADGCVDAAGWIVGTLPFGEKYGRVAPGELVLRFAAGRVVDVAGTRAPLVADVTRVIDRVAGLGGLAEFGFGVARGLDAAVARTPVGCLWHERRYGVHLGIGATLERDGRETGHHLDFVLASGVVEDAAGTPILAW